jgi:hypothetical protein
MIARTVLCTAILTLTLTLAATLTHPLLDIDQALVDADRNLADFISYTHTLQGDTEGSQALDAEAQLAALAAEREVLTALLPPALVQAITAEPVVYDEEEEDWKPATYKVFNSFQGEHHDHVDGTNR